MAIKWFDNQTTFDFFYNNYTDKNFQIFNDKTFYNKMNKHYNLAPELSNFHKLKERTKLLSNIYGKQYSQSLLYWHLILNRFIRLSIPINRLSYLLNDTFLYFESFLNINIKWQDGKRKYYRDHTLHTTGEAYLGVQFLLNNSKIRETMIDHLKITSHETGRFFREFSYISEDNIDHIIYKTWLISSLFHDLGYVISFNKELNSNMRKFHPYSSMLYKSNFPSFEELQFTLGNSLLFRTVDHDDIKKSYDNDKHGVFSSMLLLLTYYSAPAFDGVSHDDRISIELAAKSIFFHDYPDEPKEDIKINNRNNFTENHIRLLNKNIEEDILNLIHINMETDNSKIFKCKQIIFNYSKSCSNSERTLFSEDPFAFFLRFIDELQVFGRSQLSFVHCNKGESDYSFQSNLIRNLIRFPSQVVRFEEKIKIYYILDDSLIAGDFYNKDFADWANINIENSGIKFFLKELFWLQKSIKDMNKEKINTFPELEFYLIYV